MKIISNQACTSSEVQVLLSGLSQITTRFYLVI